MRVSDRKIQCVSEGLRKDNFSNRFGFNAWSPGSRMVVFTQGGPKTTSRLLVSWPDTGRRVTVFIGQLGGTRWIRWDEGRLYYATMNDEMSKIEIWVWDSTSAKSESVPPEEIKRFAVHKHEGGEWACRNDLRVYHEFKSVESPDDTRDLYIESQMTGKKTKLLADAWCPARSPDGRYVVFSWKGELWLYDLKDVRVE